MQAELHSQLQALDRAGELQQNGPLGMRGPGPPEWAILSSLEAPSFLNPSRMGGRSNHRLSSTACPAQGAPNTKAPRARQINSSPLPLCQGVPRSAVTLRLKVKVTTPAPSPT